MEKYNISIDCIQFAVTAISAMQKLQQYRQIGTLEECREAMKYRKSVPGLRAD